MSSLWGDYGLRPHDVTFMQVGGRIERCFDPEEWDRIKQVQLLSDLKLRDEIRSLPDRQLMEHTSPSSFAACTDHMEQLWRCVDHSEFVLSRSIGMCLNVRMLWAAGTYYPRLGPRQLAKATISIIEAAGGRVMVSTTVK